MLRNGSYKGKNDLNGNFTNEINIFNFSSGRKGTTLRRQLSEYFSELI